MARIPAFQAGCVGSIPITRSIVFTKVKTDLVDNYETADHAPLAQLDRATAF